MNVVSAITGLPYVGKTTLFNLLTGAHASTGAFAGAEAETNVGVAKVPDPRVEQLAALYKPKKITHAEVMYRDIGLAHAEKPGQAISPQKLGDLRTADAIVHAAHHYRREWFVGGSTVVAIQGNKIAPGFGDWYLAQQGYGAQQQTNPLQQLMSWLRQ